MISAALESFAEEGIEVPMETIAKRAGVGVATIYRQFPTKESLFEAVVLQEMQKVFALAREAERAEDPEAALAEFIDTLLDTVASKRDLAQALERSGIKSKEKSPEMQEIWRSALSGLVERAKQEGVIRPELSIDEVLFMISGTCSAVINHGPDRASREQMARVVCHGLRPDPTTKTRPA